MKLMLFKFTFNRRAEAGQAQKEAVVLLSKV